jgi:hypothetical protein
MRELLPEEQSETSPSIWFSTASAAFCRLLVDYLVENFELVFDR